MKLILYIATLIFLCVTAAVAQENRPAPDRWAGMVLDVSTPEDAIRLFGQPSKDKDKISLELPRPLSWLSDKYKQKVFRTLTYKRMQEFENVQFSFLDGRLVSIAMEAPNGEIDDRWIDPDNLEQLFGVAFKPTARKYGKKLPPPADFHANAPSELKKDDYDYWYDLIAVSEHSFIVAIADNYQYQSGIFASPDAKKRKQINARGVRYPGYVSDIELISRTLAAS
jgi:hypothetical protein